MALQLQPGCLWSGWSPSGCSKTCAWGPLTCLCSLQATLCHCGVPGEVLPLHAHRGGGTHHWDSGQAAGGRVLRNQDTHRAGKGWSCLSSPAKGGQSRGIHPVCKQCWMCRVAICSLQCGDILDPAFSCGLTSWNLVIASCADFALSCLITPWFLCIRELSGTYGHRRSSKKAVRSHQTPCMLPLPWLLLCKSPLPCSWLLAGTQILWGRHSAAGSPCWEMDGAAQQDWAVVASWVFVSAGSRLCWQRCTTMGFIVPSVTLTTWTQFMKVTAFLPLRPRRYLGLRVSLVREVSGKHWFVPTPGDKMREVWFLEENLLNNLCPTNSCFSGVLISALALSSLIPVGVMVVPAGRLSRSDVRDFLPLPGLVLQAWLP